MCQREVSFLRFLITLLPYHTYASVAFSDRHPSQDAGKEGDDPPPSPEAA